MRIHLPLTSFLPIVLPFMSLVVVICCIDIYCTELACVWLKVKIVACCWGCGNKFFSTSRIRMLRKMALNIELNIEFCSVRKKSLRNRQMLLPSFFFFIIVYGFLQLK
uniref:Uncharacterized protein n=1 Tax=Amblyomma cajennense TaxID=34607 RepID=A0A023FBR8_AMBCJ